MVSYVAHLDADCFYVSAERVRHPDEIPDRLPKGFDPGAAAEGIPESGGTMSLGFGLVEFKVPKFKGDAVRYFQLWLAGILADTVGVLLALLWTVTHFAPPFCCHPFATPDSADSNAGCTEDEIHALLQANQAAA